VESEKHAEGMLLCWSKGFQIYANAILDIILLSYAIPPLFIKYYLLNEILYITLWRSESLNSNTKENAKK
jgi:hypothetical protein